VTPFWRPRLLTQQELLQDALDTSVGGFGGATRAGALAAIRTENFHLQSSKDGAAAWDRPLVNGQPLPGLVRMTKEPDLELAENFSKPKDKDAYVRKVLALKAPEFAFECTLLTPEHLLAYEQMQPLLLPVYRVDGRAEVLSISHPLVNIQEIHWAIVIRLKPEAPKEGSPLKMTVHFRAFFPNPPKGAAKTVRQNRKSDGLPVPTVDRATKAPTVPSLAALNKPSPSRTK
jgi:hypothetical protein